MWALASPWNGWGGTARVKEHQTWGMGCLSYSWLCWPLFLQRDWFLLVKLYHPVSEPAPHWFVYAKYLGISWGTGHCTFLNTDSQTVLSTIYSKVKFLHSWTPLIKYRTPGRIEGFYQCELLFKFSWFLLHNSFFIAESKVDFHTLQNYSMREFGYSQHLRNLAFELVELFWKSSTIQWEQEMLKFWICW